MARQRVALKRAGWRKAQLCVCVINCNGPREKREREKGVRYPFQGAMGSSPCFPTREKRVPDTLFLRGLASKTNALAIRSGGLNRNGGRT
jgi:hypothetical protein